VLDRFAIDWSLCMYCGICVEECPYDALEWTSDLTQPGPSSKSLVEEMVHRQRVIDVGTRCEPSPTSSVLSRIQGWC
jgi:formate hydrogenlyase subunit 6/NADH:ubiquinone oxidoreductase subunit I